MVMTNNNHFIRYDMNNMIFFPFPFLHQPGVITDTKPKHQNKIKEKTFKGGSGTWYISGVTVSNHKPGKHICKNTSTIKPVSTFSEKPNQANHHIILDRG